jgi:CRISPR-associated protein Cmr2
LQFSLGPVQGFVAQSRRTRDLWSSSFLLSHLAAVAMDVVQSSSPAARFVLPAWDKMTSEANRQHDFGTVPNRFVVDFASADDARSAAQFAKEKIDGAWRKIADEVWKTFVEPVADPDSQTKAIWDRQVANFWEVSWVIGSVEESSQLLAARKNWRMTSATVEPGDHCTMMNDRQELSGMIRSQARVKQDEFWSALRSRVGKLDLAEDERLCAIALIKRMFPKVAEQAIGRKLDQTKLDQTSWPSTAYVAAIPWLIEVAKCPQTQDSAEKYAQEVKRLAENSLGERQTRIPKLKDLKKQRLTGEFLSLDGNFFQRAAISNPRVTPLEKQTDGIEDAAIRRELQRALDELSKKAGSKPSAFYALLLMDGDSMGALIGAARKLESADGESLASQALSQFSRGVPDVVGSCHGVTLYAGGDDVLAMLPLDSALSCAIKLTDSYCVAFKDLFGFAGEEIVKQATISGAIVYAHYHTPLREVLQTAHHLLDDVAKDATGRDSLAVAVFKSSGITAQWSAPWEHIRATNKDAKRDVRSGASNIIDELVEDLQGKSDRGKSGAGDTERSAEFSSGFLYNVRERFAALTDSALRRSGEFGELSEHLREDDLLKSVLIADYMRGLSHRGDPEVAEQNRHKAKVAIERLLQLCQRVKRRRIEGSDPPQYEPIKPDENTLGIDGALLVRFLAGDGKEDAE